MKYILTYIRKDTKMDIKLRNKIVAATTLVSLVIIGISIGVWSMRGEESKILLHDNQSN